VSLVLHCVLLLVALALYGAGRRHLPREILCIDSFFLGLVLFQVGAMVAAYQFLAAYQIIDPPAEQVLLLATTSLVCAASSTLFLKPVLQDLPPIQADPQPLREDFVFATTLFLVISNVGFCYLIYSTLLDGSLSSLSKPRELLSIRKLIASGERGYYFPGLIKQIRDILAPAFVYYLAAYSKKHRLALSLIIFTTLVAIFFSGQRLPLVVLTWAIFMGRAMRHSRERATTATQERRLRPTRLAGYAAACIVPLTAINHFLGRADPESSGLQSLVAATAGIFERSVVVVPLANMVGFEFVMDQRYGFCQLWLAGLATLVPGSQGAALSNELHAFLGGSLQGNATLGFPVATYVNVGYVGVVVVSGLVMFLFAVMDRRLAGLNSPLVAGVRIVVLAFLPLCYDPNLFLLNGGLMLLVVTGWISFATARRARSLEDEDEDEGEDEDEDEDYRLAPMARKDDLP
jgi:hypothetical protein